MSPGKVACVKCEKEEPEVDVDCTKCEGRFHRSCITGRFRRREDVVCDECATRLAAKGPPALDQTLTIGGEKSFAEGPKSNSTAIPLHGGENLEQRNRELEDMVKELQAQLKQVLETVIPSLTSSSVPKAVGAEYEQPQSRGVVPGGSANGSTQEQQHDTTRGTGTGISQNSSLDTSLWRSRLPQSLVDKAMATPTVTKEQLARRKAGTVLPTFSGDPFDFLKFITRYLETSGDKCGFSTSEDMDRVLAALKDGPLQLAWPYRYNPDNVDLVIGRLQQAYGQPAMLLEAVASRVEALPKLKDDLSNLATFSGEVDQVRNVAILMPELPVDGCLIVRLEKKLTLLLADKWLDYKGRFSMGTIAQMADFLLDQHDRMIALHRDTLGASTRKTVLHTHGLTEDPSNEGAPIVTSAGTNVRAGTRRSHPIVKSAAAAAKAESCILKCSATHQLHLCPVFKELPVFRRKAVAKAYGRCYLCLGSNHRQKQCASTAVCDVNECGWPHNNLLHPDDVRVEKVLNFTQTSHPETFYKILPVIVRCGERERRVQALMDNGSSVTLVDDLLAREMGMDGPSYSLALSWCDGELQPARRVKQVELEVINPDDGTTFLAKASTHKNLKLPSNNISLALLEEEGLAHLPINYESSSPPCLLIGQDNSIIMRPLSSVLGKSQTVYATETPMGYALEGELPTTERTCLKIGNSSEYSMTNLIEQFINGEHFGLQPDEATIPRSDADQLAMRMMTENLTQRDDGHYEVGLLWAAESVCLPDNRDSVLRRHHNFEKKLWRDPDLCDRVKKLIQGYITKGYCREINNQTAVAGKTWYLPIFTVANPAKPEKTRLVWDCAAKYGGQSLNTTLMTGPDLTQPLINILQRFRTGPVAISGDIEEMYHQVAVKEEDRSAQRFFWRCSPEDELKEYEMTVLMFGTNCSPSLAQHAKNINASRFAEQMPKAVAAVTDDHYVDDFLNSGHTEEEVLLLARQVHQIHKSGGFNMRKWQSNSPAVLRGLDSNTGTETEVSLSSSSILGMPWNCSNDCLFFRFHRDQFRPALMNGEDAPTKREMLRVVMSIFDPLGLVSFLTIEGKIILREAWRVKAGWDDKLGGGIQRRWGEWTRHLSIISDVRVPRWHGTDDNPVDLHVFVDASETALCAVCYVVQTGRDGKRIRSLCFAKCLVAPLKTKSIPRLELDAAVLGVRVLGIVQAAHPWRVDNVHFWSDAEDVLCWIRSTERRYSPYVGNRITEILRASTVKQWRWVPTAENPADWGTKWSAKREPGDLWWCGPQFLDGPVSSWPDRKTDRQPLEVRPLLLNVQQKRSPCFVPDAARFSRWNTLVGAGARMLKCVRIMRKRQCAGDLTEADRHIGEVEIFRDIQQPLLQDSQYRTFLAPLTPFLDESNVLRMRGRAARADHLPLDARFPVILLNDHPATTLLIEHYHRHNNHQNTSAVINELRQRVVMPRMRATVRKVIARCQTCLVNRARPVAPEMSALPVARIAAYQPPFSFTGVDYFGPVEVIVGRTRREKRWCALFTCLTTRAVYLELVTSLSTESCMAAIDSLVTRRGMPKELHSDNASCFAAAAKEYVGPNGQRMRWRFIPPGCPSMGGAWERLVGAVKYALVGLKVPPLPREEALRRALLCAERLVNARPLTEFPPDVEEEEALTPNHFLLGSSNGINGESDMTQWEPRAHLKRWEEIAARLWERWVTEYLPSISTRSKWQKKVPPVAVGDLVFLCDTDHRGGWRRGVITVVHYDKESQQVRDVMVRTADGKLYRRGASRVAMFLRPIADQPVKEAIDDPGSDDNDLRELR